MKKIASLSICILLSTSLYSQVTYVLKAGVSWSSITFNEDVNEQFPGEFDYGYKPGFMIGVALEIPVVPRFTIQPELLFLQKGYKSSYADSEISSSYKTTLNYIEVPAMARLNFGKFYMAAGPSIAFGVGGNYKGTNNYMGLTNEMEGKVKFGEQPDGYNGSKQYINAVDMGLQFGTGVSLKAIVVDLRFGLGLTDIFNEQDVISNSRNRSIQLTVGLPMRSKK